MRTRFDQFTKEVLASCLAEAGDVDREHETSPERQTVDIWFVPDTDPSTRRLFIDPPVRC